jgi:uncharacterized protein with FMN-binding domain
MTTATLDRDQDQERAERLARLSASRAAARPSPSSGRVTSGTRRRHPAKGSRITALALSVATTGSLAYGLAAADRTAASSAAASGIGTVAAPGGSAGSGAGAIATTSVAGAPTYTGTTVQTRWGPVQVAVSVSGNEITDVTTLQYPNDRGRSVAINQSALPILRQEALQAQSASIDTVSGATYTSDGYVQSLQSAIDQARAAGVLVTA